VGQENFILPLVSILESIQVSAGDVSRIAGSTEVFKLRDEYLPIVRLHRIFDLTPSHADFSEGLIVVVENDRQRVGIFVDELLGQQQVVIKSLETNFRRVDGLSGATILGDGTVALILDVPGLLRLQQLHADRPDRPPTPGGNRARGSRAESAA
ncbi:MAG: chemotaxis protein CheW, partial [Planctomycetota bacterium]